MLLLFRFLPRPTSFASTSFWAGVGEEFTVSASNSTGSSFLGPSTASAMRLRRAWEHRSALPVLAPRRVHSLLPLVDEGAEGGVGTAGIAGFHLPLCRGEVTGPAVRSTFSTFVVHTFLPFRLDRYPFIALVQAH